MSPTLADTELASLHKPPLRVKTAPLTGLDLKGKFKISVHYFEGRNLTNTSKTCFLILFLGRFGIKNIRNKDKTKQRRLVRLRHSSGVHIRPIGPELEL